MLSVFSDLLSQYLMNGDLIGFINAVYTSLLGEIWYAIPLAIIFIPLYIKTGSLTFCSIMWILLGSLLVGLLPARAATVGTTFIILGIAVLLYKLVSRAF